MVNHIKGEGRHEAGSLNLGDGVMVKSGVEDERQGKLGGDFKYSACGAKTATAT